MATVIEGDFEWDEVKAAANLEKHGVSFAEAATVFADPLSIYLDDGAGTDRVVVIGMSLRTRVIYVGTWNAARGTELSVRARQPDPSAKSTRVGG